MSNFSQDGEGNIQDDRQKMAPHGDYINADIDKDARNINVGKDISSVNIENVENVQNSTIAGRDIEQTTVEGDQFTLGNIKDSVGLAIGRGAQSTINFFSGSSTTRWLRNRNTILSLVNTTWIQGVLRRSLHNEIAITLSIVKQKNATSRRPWAKIVHTDDDLNVDEPEPLMINKEFEAYGQSLLILGEPGSGKTTTLLELAEITIELAENDLTKSIPVVFNLSTWSREAKIFADWLTNQLQLQYGIPDKVATEWIENDDLLLLLDGLDEVQEQYRNECVAAINTFLQSHLVPIVVCCRRAEYERLDIKLDLRGAILLKPLTKQQILDYLSSLGPELIQVRETIENNSALAELAKSPLMLNVMVLAYHGRTMVDLQDLESNERQRAHLFDTYIDRAFK